ncbi:MAG: phage major capsid protein [Rhodospirillales bacterium]|jgi:HK97 family phage major capsid protein|nr:phage major capsid protein [Rhodospirillales bacterium]
MKSKELREKRAALLPRMQTLRDKHHSSEGWTEEDRANWTKVNDEYNELSRQIEAAEQAEEVDRRLAEVQAQQQAAIGDRSVGREDTTPPLSQSQQPATEEDRELAFGAWCCRTLGLPLTRRQRDAVERTSFPIRRRTLSVPLLRTQGMTALQRAAAGVHPARWDGLLEGRALSAIQGAAGGFTVLPEQLVRSLEVALLTFGGVRATSEIIRTTTAEPLSWPTANDTSNMGRRIGESGAVDTTGVTTAEPTFRKTTWYAYKYTSDAILVPYELLRDSVFDLSGVLGAMLGERLARKTAVDNTTGTGAAEPRGIVTGSVLGVTAAAANAITSDEIIQLEHSVDAGYRVGAGYMMHDSVALAIRLLKDGEGRYIWRAGLMEGRPDTLNGRPLAINQAMASAITNSAITMLFGQLNTFKIREVGTIRLYRLEERYRDNDQDGFMAFLEQDAGPLDAGTHPIRHLQQAA